jgi:non-specific serine/threonine protein kinase
MLSSNALPIGTRIHEFEIRRVIGEGGFSVVYLAFDHTLHRSIALKEYIPSALASRRGDNTVAVRSAQHQQTFEAGLRSFINEARLLAQFDHPALVKVYRFWEANGTAYMAMPFYEGRTLKQILREHPEQATEVWLKRLLVPLLDALALLHRHRCYHRDIAPDNIQVLENEAPVLLDFGAARRTIGDMTQAFTVILKPGYAPIEQYADETDLKQGPWTDVYALAAVLYGAVKRKPPPTAVARVIKDPLEPLARSGVPGFDETFLAGIDHGLAVRPEARPQSIDEWRGLLGMQEFEHPSSLHLPAHTSSAYETAAAIAPHRTGASEPATTQKETTDQAAEPDRSVNVPG